MSLSENRKPEIKPELKYTADVMAEAVMKAPTNDELFKKIDSIVAYTRINNPKYPKLVNAVEAAAQKAKVRLSELGIDVNILKQDARQRAANEILNIFADGNERQAAPDKAETAESGREKAARLIFSELDSVALEQKDENEVLDRLRSPLILLRDAIQNDPNFARDKTFQFEAGNKRINVVERDSKMEVYLTVTSGNRASTLIFNNPEQGWQNMNDNAKSWQIAKRELIEQKRNV